MRTQMQVRLFELGRIDLIRGIGIKIEAGNGTEKIALTLSISHEKENFYPTFFFARGILRAILSFFLSNKKLSGHENRLRNKLRIHFS